MRRAPGVGQTAVAVVGSGGHNVREDPDRTASALALRPLHAVSFARPSRRQSTLYSNRASSCSRRNMISSAPDQQIRRRTDGHWEWFEAATRPPYEISGKYLFFATDRDILIAIALEELGTGIYHVAKTH